eukprot:jgi/Bigna1/89012/estExt_fgenesh1_pg.C_420076
MWKRPLGKELKCERKLRRSVVNDKKIWSGSSRPISENFWCVPDTSIPSPPSTCYKMMLGHVFRAPTRRGGVNFLDRASRRFLSTIQQTPCGLCVDTSLPPSFNKILIANRGEIACRVIRTCREVGVKTVAVFSDADMHAEHVRMADEAVRIGEPPAAQSYLLGDKILEIAAQTGAEAIHPGYGFLSENAQFADACIDAGIKFIGPPSKAIHAMGSKSASKIIMTDAKVPVVPGYHGEDQSESKLVEEANKIGYPLMIKACVSGVSRRKEDDKHIRESKVLSQEWIVPSPKCGGGKGMRIVRSADEFLDMLDSAKRESMKSFSDDNVLLERFIERPRHIEFQVFADQQGSAVHLYERDCSVQRRHQKVLEEAPAPGMSAELRATMGESAVNAAKAVGYEGAGTVEFIFDAETNDYFFMEMNTRLQVERHPLPANQEEINATVQGHAIEARIYAEDPDNGFLPAVGKLHHVRYPEVNGETRVETGIKTGDEVSIFYDPMIAKLVVLGNSRAAALKKLDQGLSELQIVGCPTNIKFLRRCLANKDFVEGEVETNFIEENMENLFPEKTEALTLPEKNAACLLAYRMMEFAAQEGEAASKLSEDSKSPWFSRSFDRAIAPTQYSIDLMLQEPGEKAPTPVAMTVVRTGEKSLSVEIAGEGEAKIEVTGIHQSGADALNVKVGDAVLKGNVVVHENSLFVYTADASYCFQLKVPEFSVTDGAGGDGCVAPMAGKVVKLIAAAGQSFSKGDQLVILEAMKMEHVVKAPRDGVVKDVMCAEGDFVEGKKLVISFEPE